MLSILTSKTDAGRARVRAYTAADIPVIVDYVAKWLPQMPNYRFVTVSRKRLATELAMNVNNATYCVLLLEDDEGVFGGISGAVYPMPFCYDVFAEDQFLFVDPEKRSLFNVNMLIEAFVMWARARRARIIQGSQTSGIKPEAFAVLMKRRGFTEVGRIYHLITEA